MKVQYRPTISIITVTYNRADTLEQTIASVAGQTYPNIEYIIIDGGSTDATVKIVEKYKAHISRFVSESDDGIYDAMNKGVALATGDYVQIIGSDDALVDSSVIENAVAELTPDVDILSGSEYCVHEESGRQLHYTNNDARDKRAYTGGMIPHGAMLVKRRLLVQYPFDTSYRIAADYKFFLQCYTDASVRIKYIDLPILYFAMSGVSAKAAERARGEDARIHQELGLPYTTGETSSAKKKVKTVLRQIGLLSVAQYCKTQWLTHFRWQKHHCDNPICRWCGRG